MKAFDIIMILIMIVWFVQSLALLFGYFVEYENCWGTNQTKDDVIEKWKPFIIWYYITCGVLALFLIIFFIKLGSCQI